MNCDQVRAWLMRDLDGVAEPSADVAAHLERCGACLQEAGRAKALSAAVQAALPRADVPVDFREQVMAAVAEPTAEALIEKMRRRPARLLWLAIPLAALAATWIALASFREQPAGDVIGVAELSRTEVGGVTMTALRPARLGTGPQAELRDGAVLLETSDEAVFHTAFGQVRLEANSECVVEIRDARQEDGMEMRGTGRLLPSLMTVALLTGGATVANAQGEEPAQPGGVVQVEAGKAPVARAQDVEAELKRVIALVEDARERLEALRAQLAREGRGQGTMGSLWEGARGLVTCDFEDADARAIVDFLAKQGGTTVRVPDDFGGKATLHLDGVAWHEALDALALTRGYAVVPSADGTLRLVRRTPGAPPSADRASFWVAWEQICRERDELRRLAAEKHARSDQPFAAGDIREAEMDRLRRDIVDIRLAEMYRGIAESPVPAHDPELLPRLQKLRQLYADQVRAAGPGERRDRLQEELEVIEQLADLARQIEASNKAAEEARAEGLPDREREARAQMEQARARLLGLATERLFR